MLWISIIRHRANKRFVAPIRRQQQAHFPSLSRFVYFQSSESPCSGDYVPFASPLNLAFWPCSLAHTVGLGFCPALPCNMDAHSPCIATAPPYPGQRHHSMRASLGRPFRHRGPVQCGAVISWPRAQSNMMLSNRNCEAKPGCFL